MPNAPRPGSNARALVAGLAVVFIVLGIWGLIRLGHYTWVLWSQPATGLEQALRFIVPLHLPIAALCAYAGRQMLRFKPWTRTFFAYLLILIGIDLMSAAWVMGLGNGNAQPQEVLSLQIASLVALFLLAGLAWLLAWKLHRDPTIKRVFEAPTASDS